MSDRKYQASCCRRWPRDDRDEILEAMGADGFGDLAGHGIGEGLRSVVAIRLMAVAVATPLGAALGP